MKVLIDGDVLRYELGAVSIAKDEIFGMIIEKPWSVSEVNDLVDSKVQQIIDKSGADSYEMFLTGSGNFRIAIATIAPYKGQRKGDKPYHWDTVSKRLKERWNAVEYCGIEADDIMAIRATEIENEAPGTVIIASRDKDLRQVPCLHYSWACGENQPERPTYPVDYLGWIDWEKQNSGGYKLTGVGLRFFYGQLLVGDTVDNIKGCPKVGPLKAVTALKFLTTEKELFDSCVTFYIKVYGEDWKRHLVENARLLYLIRDRSWIQEEPMEGNLVKCYLNKLWETPNDYCGYDTGTEVSESNGGSPDSGD